VRQGLRLSSRHYVVLNRSTIKSGHEYEHWNDEKDRDLISRGRRHLSEYRNLRCSYLLGPVQFRGLLGRLFSMPLYSVSGMSSSY
jgi:hypothetical protein